MQYLLLVCAANFVDNIVLGRRRQVRSIANVAGGCCKNDLCNNQHPSNMTALTDPVTPDYIGNVTQPSISTTSNPVSCQDIPGSTCLNLALTVPNMCQSDCLSSRVCPRTCAKCVECYTCEHVSRPEECNRTAVCQSNQECFSLVTLDSSFNQGYRLGCMDHNTCANFYKSTPNAFGRRQNFEVGIQGGCCHSDFCNHHVTKPTTQPPTTTSASTSTNAPASHQSCNKTHGGCPHTSVREDNYCYLVGPTELSWTEAKAYCIDMCTHLAHFHDSDDVHDVNHALRHNHHESFEYYIDAISNEGHWYWSSNGNSVPVSVLHPSHRSGVCGVMTSHNDHHLDDSSCTDRHKPLCQIKLRDDDK